MSTGTYAVPPEGAEVYVDGVLIGTVAAPEPTPIFDALVDEWPEHVQRLREERLRTSMAGVGRAFRQMAGLITAMGDGLRDGGR